MKRRTARPILITDASRSQDDELRRRQIRYVAMMSIRAACLIIGAVLVSAEAPLLWLWLPLCGAGMIIIPWLAVMLANDRPPKQQHRLSRGAPRADDAPPRSLPAERPGPVIDAEL